MSSNKAKVLRSYEWAEEGDVDFLEAGAMVEILGEKPDKFKVRQCDDVDVVGYILKDNLELVTMSSSRKKDFDKEEEKNCGDGEFDFGGGDNEFNGSGEDFYDFDSGFGGGDNKFELRGGDFGKDNSGFGGGDIEFELGGDDNGGFSDDDFDNNIGGCGGDDIGGFGGGDNVNRILTLQNQYTTAEWALQDLQKGVCILSNVLEEFEKTISISATIQSDVLTVVAKERGKHFAFEALKQIVLLHWKRNDFEEAVRRCHELFDLELKREVPESCFAQGLKDIFTCISACDSRTDSTMKEMQSNIFTLMLNIVRSSELPEVWFMIAYHMCSISPSTELMKQLQDFMGEKISEERLQLQQLVTDGNAQSILFDEAVESAFASVESAEKNKLEKYQNATREEKNKLRHLCASAKRILEERKRSRARQTNSLYSLSQQLKSPSIWRSMAMLALQWKLAGSQESEKKKIFRQTIRFPLENPSKMGLRNECARLLATMHFDLGIELLDRGEFRKADSYFYVTLRLLNKLENKPYAAQCLALQTLCRIAGEMSIPATSMTEVHRELFLNEDVEDSEFSCIHLLEFESVILTQRLWTFYINGDCHNFIKNLHDVQIINFFPSLKSLRSVMISRVRHVALQKICGYDTKIFPHSRISFIDMKGMLCFDSEDEMMSFVARIVRSRRLGDCLLNASERYICFPKKIATVKEENTFMKSATAFLRSFNESHATATKRRDKRHESKVMKNEERTSRRGADKIIRKRHQTGCKVDTCLYGCFSRNRSLNKKWAEEKWKKRETTILYERTEISSQAAAKMLIHAQEGVDWGKESASELPYEVMGCLIGHVHDLHPETVIIMDAIPLPCKGGAHSVEGTTEASIVLNQVKDMYEVALQEGKSQDYVVGWYHSHPGLRCFFSTVDVGTQGIWQRQFNKDGLPFVGVVVEPVESIETKQIRLSVYACYNKNKELLDVAPDGLNVDKTNFKVKKRWGASYSRYYELQSSLFTNDLHKKFIDIIDAKSFATLHSQTTSSLTSSSMNEIAIHRCCGQSQLLLRNLLFSKNEKEKGEESNVESNVTVCPSCRIGFSRYFGKIFTPDSKTISKFESKKEFVMAKKIRLASKVFRSVKLSELAGYISDASQHEVKNVLMKMIQKKDINARVDLVMGFVDFHTNESASSTFNDEVKETCNAISNLKIK
eukprot:g6199.t1